MSCFWIGILGELNAEELKLLEIRKSVPELVKVLKLLNKPTMNVIWQGKFLSNRAMLENMKHIKTYDEKTVHKGYWTSSADPFLLLCAELFSWNIVFNYNNSKIRISHQKALRTVYFRASRSHFERGR